MIGPLIGIAALVAIAAGVNWLMARGALRRQRGYGRSHVTSEDIASEVDIEP